MLFHVSEHHAWLPFSIIEADSKEKAIETLQRQIAKQSWEKVVWLTASIRKRLDSIDATPIPSVELVNSLSKIDEEIGRIARQHHLVLEQEKQDGA